MGLEFHPFSDYPRGLMVSLLQEGYAFEPRYEQTWLKSWQEADDFFYNNLQIADACGFVSALNGEAIGFICWDPRKLPESVELGHNCITALHKGNGYGQAQLQEALRRIRLLHPKRILVTTDEDLLPAQRNYERAGFKLIGRRKNPWNADYAGDLLDYEIDE